VITDLAFFRATMPESSALATGADDALKDLDNTWFLRGQPEDVRAAWFERIRILRLVDRLAENERVEPEAGRFSLLLDAWYTYGIDGKVDTSVPYGAEINEVLRLWVSGSERDAFRQAWSFGEYADAVGDYGLARMAVEDMKEHKAMLGCISGAMFQLFPFVRDEHRRAIWHFGILDGFYNNLRDLAEDSAAGLCHFPVDVLERHGLTRDDVLTGRCIGTAGWERMMRFWLDDYLPTLRNAAQPFIEATGLHPSLEAMREWCLHRYRRTESVFREVGHDYRAFSVLYWSRVRLELAERSEAA
jgi:phytoene synthase